MSEKTRWCIRFEGHDIEVFGWPDRPFSAKKVFTDGNAKYAVNDKGKFFCNIVSRGNSYFPTPGSIQLSILYGLATIGHPHLKRAAIKAIRLQRLKSQELRNKGYAAEQLIQYATKANVQLTPVQLRKAQAMVRLGKKHEDA